MKETIFDSLQVSAWQKGREIDESNGKKLFLFNIVVCKLNYFLVFWVCCFLTQLYLYESNTTWKLNKLKVNKYFKLRNYFNLAM